jgi:uncharacterized membrane protein
MMALPTEDINVLQTEELTVKRSRFTLSLTLALALSMSQAWAQSRYTVADFGDFQPSAITGPWVAGYDSTGPALLNLDQGTLVELPDLGFSGRASGVNAHGEAVGIVYVNPEGQSAPARWDAMHQLSFLRDTGLIPRGMNEGGIIFGTKFYPGVGLRAVRYWPDERTQDLPTLGGSHSFAWAIDAAGRIWGQANTTHDQTEQAVVWDLDGRIVNMDTLGSQASQLLGSNAAGVAVGDAFIGGRNIAVWATIEAGMSPLPSLPDRTDCMAEAINASDVAVGRCFYATWQPPDTQIETAVIWPAGGGVFDLNTLIEPVPGVILERAIGISDEGKIIAVGTMNGQEFRWFLLEPEAEAFEPPSRALRLTPGPAGVILEATLARGSTPIAGAPVWGSSVSHATWQWTPVGSGATDAGGRWQASVALPPGTHQVILSAWVDGAEVPSDWAFVHIAPPPSAPR